MGPRRTLRRYEGLDHARYLTCSCFHRLPLFQNDAIKGAFVQHLAFVQQAMRFELYAWVVMPEHLHVLLRPASPDQTVTEILRRIKSPFGREVIARWRTLNAPILSRITDQRGTTRFWQSGGGYDRNIYSDEELLAKIDYIHANPVRRELAERTTDYRWSSATHYANVRYVGPRVAGVYDAQRR